MRSNPLQLRAPPFFIGPKCKVAIPVHHFFVRDALAQASLGIFKGLQLLFSKPLSDEWVRLVNNGLLFGGRSPIDTMIQGGIPKMLEVRRYIDGLRSGM